MLTKIFSKFKLNKISQKIEDYKFMVFLFKQVPFYTLLQLLGREQKYYNQTNNNRPPSNKKCESSFS